METTKSEVFISVFSLSLTVKVRYADNPFNMLQCSEDLLQIKFMHAFNNFKRKVKVKENHIGQLMVI